MTVKSLIEPKLEYSENKTVDIDDIHYSTSIYVSLKITKFSEEIIHQFNKRA